MEFVPTSRRGEGVSGTNVTNLIIFLEGFPKPSYSLAYRNWPLHNLRLANMCQGKIIQYLSI